MEVIEHLPLLAVLRDSRGKVLAVSAQLAALEKRRLVGRSVRSLWPDRATEWLAKDELARALGRPLCDFELSASAIAFETVRIPQPDDRTLWLGRSVGDQLVTGAILALADLANTPTPFVVGLGRETDTLKALARHESAADIRDKLGIDRDNIAGACIRLLSLAFVRRG